MSAEIVEEVLFGEPNDAVQGPEICDQVVVAIPEEGAGSFTVAVWVTVVFVVAFVKPEITGATVSQTSVNCEEVVLLALSVTVSLTTYVPSWFADTVVFKAFGVPKVTIPGPET